jgi:hypothetical protein
MSTGDNYDPTIVPGPELEPEKMVKRNNWLDPETAALLQAGFIQTADVVFLFLVLASLIFCVGFFIFGKNKTVPEYFILLTILLQLTWIITLCYRTCYFILKTHAAIVTLPEAAAKLAVKFQMNQLATGQEPVKKKL